ncbi:MAG TPA: helix-turn-helix domain-containing protein [Candidatus Limnocylindrales bacterium]
MGTPPFEVNIRYSITAFTMLATVGPVSSHTGRRRYEAPARRAKAALTRRAILDAAEAEFARVGYTATTVVALAHAAGVAPETVYAVFGSKLGVLEALVGRAIGGDDEPLALFDRAWVGEMAREPDLDRRVDRLASEGAAILARRSAVDEVVTQAAGADPEAAKLLAITRRERLEGQRRLLELVMGHASGVSRDALEEAGDSLFAIGSPEVYRLLVVGRGWSHAHFASWYAAAIRNVVASARSGGS